MGGRRYGAPETGLQRVPLPIARRLIDGQADGQDFTRYCFVGIVYIFCVAIFPCFFPWLFDQLRVFVGVPCRGSLHFADRLIGLGVT